jgi:hypothetical protein
MACSLSLCSESNSCYRGYHAPYGGTNLQRAHARHVTLLSAVCKMIATNRGRLSLRNFRDAPEQSDVRSDSKGEFEPNHLGSPIGPSQAGQKKTRDQQSDGLQRRVVIPRTSTPARRYMSLRSSIAALSAPSVILLRLRPSPSLNGHGLALLPVFL